jgi:RNA polymerase sigma-70 factor (ECF subfamily)
VGEIGERAAVDHVVPHRETLRRYALRLSGNASDADDLVQETLARALDADSLPEPDAVIRWLMVTLYRLFVDQCRKRKAEVRAHESIRHLSRAVTAERPARIPRWMQVTDEELRAAVDALPDRLRTPYVLRARGHSYKEIADKMHVSINTVSTQIRRARQALRAALTAAEAE